MPRSTIVVLVLCSACAAPWPGSAAAHPETGRGTSAAAASSPPAAEAVPSQAAYWRPMNYFDFMLGASYWDDLGSLDPTGVSPFPGRFGDFDRWGFAFDFGYDRVVWHDEKNAITVGIESGWSSFANDGSGLTSPYSDISATLFYLTPAVRWRRQLSPSVTISPGIGAGYYSLSIDEYESYYYGWWWGYSSRTLYDDSTFGGFLSLGFDFHINPSAAIRVDNKLHFVSFDGLQNLMPRETGVDGPIYTLEVGFVLAF